MKRLLQVALIALTAGGLGAEPLPNMLTLEERAAGWRLLWDGRTADGWRGAKEEAFPSAVWRMENDVLSVVPTAAGATWRGADIVTRERFSDFELSVDFKLSPGANSGIKYFVDAGPGQGGASSLGLEYQLVDNERHPDAAQGRNGNRRLAAVYDLYPAAATKPARPPGEWNSARIVARGPRVEHWLNGVRVAEYTRFTDAFRAEVQQSKYRTTPGFGEWRDGHLLLQDHGDAVSFRNLKVRVPPVRTGIGPGGHVVSVAGDAILLDGTPVKLLGLRTSNALMSDATTEELIEQLGVFQGYGVNTVSVYVMGSRFGDVKGYRPDATLDPVYAARLARILRAADRRGMIVLVGCLYWSESEAKADLGHWTQREANLAVANTVRWLAENRFHNVIVDPDNEGMANKDPAKMWSIAGMIDAGHEANPFAVIAYNARPPPPANADLAIHHAPRVPGKPYVETEGTPQVVPYWHEYSRREGYRNYLNIGVYTEAMKAEQFRDTDEGMANANGFMLASTWLQAAPPDGPNHRPGGDGPVADPGIRWWLEYIHQRHGPGRATSPRSFFALDNGVGRGEWMPAQQAATLRELGYDGISYNYTNLADLKVWQDELTRRGLRMFGLYFAAPLQGDQPLPTGLAEAVHVLRRSGTVLWMHLPARPRTAESEAVALARIRAVADLAAGADLRVVLYPHVNCLPATAEEAFDLAEKAGRPNVGLTLNLSHELAAGNGTRLPEIIRRVAPRLEMVTLNGATDRPGPLWENYIQPLGRGDYDVAALLRVLVEVRYAGPVGLQSYGLTGEPRANLATSMRAWRALTHP